MATIGMVSQALNSQLGLTFLLYAGRRDRTRIRLYRAVGGGGG